MFAGFWTIRAPKKITAPPAVTDDHSRIETRVATVSTAIDWLQQDHQWPGLKAIGKIVRTRETGTKITTETAYLLLSAPMNAERFGEVAKAHWAVESMHWLLDVAFKDDLSRYRTGHGAKNMAVVRRFALGLVRAN